MTSSMTNEYEEYGEFRQVRKTTWTNGKRIPRNEIPPSMSLPPAKFKSTIFGETKDDDFIHRISLAAQAKVVNPLGQALSPCAASIFILNSISGVSLLTLPFAFSQAGLVFGTLLVFVCMVVAFMTATFVVEALTIANALNYDEAADDCLEGLDSESRHNLHVQHSHLKELGHPLVRESTLADLKSEIRRKHAGSAFRVRERVELGIMGEAVVNRKLSAAFIYCMILCYTYGSILATLVTINLSLAEGYCNARELLELSCSPDDVDEAYTVFVMSTFLVTLCLCFGDLQKTKSLTIAVMYVKFFAVCVLVLVSLQHAYHEVQVEGWSIFRRNLNVPTWDSSGFAAVFSSSVYMFCVHANLPVTVSPVRPFERAPRAILFAFLCVFTMTIIVCASALIAWNNNPHDVCASSPGGHFCRIQHLYTLNFKPLGWCGGFVGLFIVLYPSLTLLTLPATAMTTRSTLGFILGVRPSTTTPYTLANLGLTLLVLVPPFVVTYLTKNVQAVMVGVGYAGLTVQLLLPIIVLRRSREILHYDDETEHDHKDRPLKSRFAKPAVYLLVVCMYVVAFSLTTQKVLSGS